jgi:hypothetical protein
MVSQPCRMRTAVLGADHLGDHPARLPPACAFLRCGLCVPAVGSAAIPFVQRRRLCTKAPATWRCQRVAAARAVEEEVCTLGRMLGK